DDEPVAVGKPRALVQVVRNAADEIAGVEAVVLEDPGEQRRRGGLAVRAGDDDRAFAADEKFLEQFRQRTIAELVIERELGFGIAAGNGVADDDEVGLVRKIAFRV